jgi:hypothetical protein
MCRLTDALRPTDRLVRALLVPAVVFIATSVDRNYQTDLWHHLARGRVLIEEGVLLDSDRFTFTVSGQPLRDVNWLWQAAFYWLYRAGGLALVQTVNSAVLALTMGLLFGLASRRSGSRAVACGVCIVAFLGLWPLLIIRPQSFSLLLFTLLIIALENAARNRFWLLLPPLIMAAWVNLHGGFPVGLMLIGAYALGAALSSSPLVGEARSFPSPLVGEGGGGGYTGTDAETHTLDPDFSPQRGRVTDWLARCLLASWPLLLCLVLSIVATLCNPYGWHVYEYVGLTSGRASSRHIDEWLPPGFDSLTGKVFALALAATLFLAAIPRRRLAPKETIVLCCFLVPALASVRMVAWWLLLWAPAIAACLTSAWPRLHSLDAGEERVSRSAGLASAALVALALLSTPWVERYNPAFLLPGRGHRTETDLQAAADFLAESGSHRIFTRFAWGEYLGWALAPDSTVFMDGRIEIIPDEVWGEYAAVTRGRADWEELLSRYNVDCLVLDASGYDGQLLPLVGKSQSWQMAFRQQDVCVFLRETGPQQRGTAVTPLSP